MTSSLNKVTLIGNLGRDPEVRYTPGGVAIATLSVATSSRRKNKTTGNWEDEVQWHRVTLLGDQAQWAGEKLTKGRTVYIEGGLRYGSFVKDGQRIPTVEILAMHIEPFGSKKPAQEDAPADLEQRQQANNNQPPSDADGLNDEQKQWVSSYDQA